MDRVQVRSNEMVCAGVKGCEVTSDFVWNEGGDCESAVWGVRVIFSNGKTTCLPDLCTKKSEAEELKSRLDGSDIEPDFLKYVVDDYLGEIYGRSFYEMVNI